MKIKLTIPYKTSWGQTICISGSSPELSAWDENKAVEMQFVFPDLWSIELEIKNTDLLEYRYLLKENGKITRREWERETHFLQLDRQKSYTVNDCWIDTPKQIYFYSSAFTDGFFRHDIKKADEVSYRNAVLFQVYSPYVAKNQSLIVCGESAAFGGWNPKRGLELISVKAGVWQVVVDVSYLEDVQAYKLAIYDKEKDEIVRWEDGDNRLLRIAAREKSASKTGRIQIESVGFRYNWMNWRAAGVAIPVFSLRSEDGFGIGEFSDLKKIADWAHITGQKIIQILPVNDTTITHTWWDSYPYNVISNYALHPIYLRLKDLPLKNKSANRNYRKLATTLNALPTVDYEKVMELKTAYINDLFNEIGAATLTEEAFTDFYEKNKSWLFPYALFCYFRDKFHTANFELWETFSRYDEQKLNELANSDSIMKSALEKIYFTQYLLDLQLSEAKQYANEKNVVLKGDIPIGISRHSVEAWIEPELFNLDAQTGAPPDDFSVTGQNWGFPTYKWDEMRKDGYAWWRKRFRKMADYFDIYRIDHILGFFRIWEIPESSVQGLLGYFIPTLPLSVQEIEHFGLAFDEERMTNPIIHEQFLFELFQENTQEVTDNFLQRINESEYFRLKEEYDTQKKIKKIFEEKDDEKSSRICSGLYQLCNEVLFIRDKKEPEKFHPRIAVAAQHSFLYRELDDASKDAFNHLHDYYFYQRHSDFWKNEALQKLPPLISATDMLACGEDLGMLPSSVPEVMNKLQILSLEIERMPKTFGVSFENLSQLPYLSVCATSTHDMPPIRLWWKENRNLTQRYYNEVLGQLGIAPEDCSSDLCRQIVSNHLNAPSMLTILPLQDWLSMSAELRRPNPEEERINIPSNPRHWWNYRMHITLDELICSTAFNENVMEMIKEAGRS